VLFFKKFEKRFVTQLDLMGPLLIALGLAMSLSLRGKFVFGYIYAFMTFGCFLVYIAVNLIIKNKYFPLYDTMSTLGYSLMPIVGLSLTATLISLKYAALLQTRAIFGLTIGLFFVLWSAATATKLINTVA
jgi:protein YIPF5/7